MFFTSLSPFTSVFSRNLSTITNKVLNNSNFLASKTPIIEQVANRSNRIYIPDWTVPWSTKGARAKHYKPNVMKRIATHGLATRLQTRGGKQILWRNILKGPGRWPSLVAAP